MQIIDTASVEGLILKTNCQVAIFDVFDTIVHRKIHPEDIKKISCDRLLKYYNIKKKGYKELYEIRAEIESQLCHQNQLNGFDQEFRYKDLAKSLYNYLCERADLNHTFSEFVELLTEIEFTTEINNQFVDDCILNTITSLLAKDIDVLICSDIYYSKDFIQQMLSHHGLEINAENIFVSSEFLVTKRSGKLFNYIAKKYNLKTCVMIGDNHESDYTRSIEKGLSAIHIDRSWIHALYKLHQKEFLESKFENRLQKIFHLHKNVLFKEFAFTSFYFIHLLYLELKQKKIKDAFFLAREGRVLKEMFDLYQDYCAKGARIKIKSHYLKVSRRATFLPSLKKLQEEKFFNLFRQYRRISTEEFLLSIGFTASEIDIITVELSINKQKRESDFPTSASYIKLLLSDNFLATYEHKRKSQKENFKKYIHSFGGGLENKIALVDVGWKGTIQDNIYKALDETTAIAGFYIGLVVNPDNTNTANTKKGLLFSAEKIEHCSSIFDENRSFFEVFFAANHGSAVSYNLQGNDTVSVETEDFSPEIHFFKSKIFPLIQSILPIFKDICQEFNGVCIDDFDLLQLAAKKHARMFLFPTEAEVSWFTNLYHVENFGIFERSEFNKKANDNILFKKIDSYFEHKKNPEKFISNVMWPVAELLKHDLPKAQSTYSQQKFNSLFKS